jgi:hypothetical protein
MPFNTFDRTWPRFGMGAEQIPIGGEGWVFTQRFKNLGQYVSDLGLWWGGARHRSERQNFRPIWATVGATKTSASDAFNLTTWESMVGSVTLWVATATTCSNQVSSTSLRPAR